MLSANQHCRIKQPLEKAHFLKNSLRSAFSLVNVHGSMEIKIFDMCCAYNYNGLIEYLV